MPRECEAARERCERVQSVWAALAAGWGTWIRTKTNRVRVCCATVTPFPNGLPSVFNSLFGYPGKSHAAGTGQITARWWQRSTRLIPPLASTEAPAFSWPRRREGRLPGVARSGRHVRSVGPARTGEIARMRRNAAASHCPTLCATARRKSSARIVRPMTEFRSPRCGVARLAHLARACNVCATKKKRKTDAAAILRGRFFE